MGAPEHFETVYQTQLPEHVQQELSARKEQVVVVPDKHPFLVGLDFVWPYVQGPLMSFILIAFLVGATVIWQHTVGKYLKPK